MARCRRLLVAALLALLLLLAVPAQSKKAAEAKAKSSESKKEHAGGGRQFFGVHVGAKKGATQKLKDADDVVLHLKQVHSACVCCRAMSFYCPFGTMFNALASP